VDRLTTKRLFGITLMNGYEVKTVNYINSLKPKEPGFEYCISIMWLDLY